MNFRNLSVCFVASALALPLAACPPDEPSASDDAGTTQTVDGDLTPEPDGGATSETDGGVVPIDEALEGLAAALAPEYCGYMERCLGEGILEVTLGGPCVDVAGPMLEDTMVSRIRDGVARGTIVFHGGSVEACLSSFGSIGCGDLEEAPEGCASLFEGRVADGGSCLWDEECASGSCANDVACPGTCVPRAAEGGDCGSTHCERGLSCVGGVCMRRSLEGEACLGADDKICATGLECVEGTPDTEGTCQPAPSTLAGLGEPCEFPSRMCEAGLSCAYAGGNFECRAQVERDGACSVAFPDQCPSGQACATGDGPTGTCTDLAAAGEPCASARDCLGALVCLDSAEGDSKTCQERARIGAACVDNNGCYSSECVDSLCAIPSCE